MQTFAIRKSGEVILTLRAQVKGDPARLRFVGHQANLLMLQAVAARGADRGHIAALDHAAVAQVVAGDECQLDRRQRPGAG